MIRADIRFEPSKAEAFELITKVRAHDAMESPSCNLSWFSSWLNALDKAPSIVVFSRKEEPIGFVFLGLIVKALFLGKWTQGYINQAGDFESDQVWIEYNHIVCSDKYERDCVIALLALADSLGINELNISLAKNTDIWASILKRKWFLEATPSFGAKVNLKLISDELSYVSKNSRYQINRSLRTIEKKFGKISIKVVCDFAEIQEYLDVLAGFHVMRWKQSEFGSGFENHIFVNHLSNLVTMYPDRAELVAVYSGNMIVGVSLNLILQNRVAFYCSGINYDIADNKIKPGYILHSQVIKYYKSIGKTEYDFLAGYARYKKSLATDIYHLNTIRLTKRNLRGTIVYLLRNAKQLFLKLKQKTNE